MKRAEFLEKLMQALAFMTAEERRSVREYYEELLDDALEAGEAEEAVLAGFGAPEEIAQRIKAEYVPQELTGAASGGTTGDKACLCAQRNGHCAPFWRRCGKAAGDVEQYGRMGPDRSGGRKRHPAGAAHPQGPAAHRPAVHHNKPADSN